ncbi:MAG: thioesterase [Bacteroidetes bacterium CG_4_10_14_3_um_filter_42_6]|nr:MAG: thioesterase [Bacteroidetes bacterium CG_4_10_14_3_um_filter_42_6]PJB58745.1 MAG: thioesterase [Bacteroidetes bacterium CG_4_9_14_3_um_filter_41_19]
MRQINRIEKLANSHCKMRLYMLWNLPLAFFARLRVDEMSMQKASISLPYNYLNKNPFRSIYFAALSMAAELSTGILAMAHVEKNPIPVSMLVLGVKAEFVKKAKTRIIFTCFQGELLEKTISQSIAENEGRTCEVFTEGLDADGEVVARFWFTWTFKPKNQQ